MTTDDQRPAAADSAPPAASFDDFLPVAANGDIGIATGMLTQAADDFRAAFHNRVAGLTPTGFVSSLVAFEKIHAQAENIAAWICLAKSAGRVVPADAEDDLRRAAAVFAFFRREICETPETTLIGLLQERGVEPFIPWIARLRAQRGHILSGSAEEFIRRKEDTAERAWQKVYDTMIAGSSVRAHADPDGIVSSCTAARDLAPRARHFSAVFNAASGLKHMRDRYRSFERGEDEYGLAAGFTSADVDALSEGVENSFLFTSQRYFLLRDAARNEGDTPRYTWAAAQEAVIRAWDDVSPEFGGMARRFFDEGWIDAAPRAGKSAEVCCRMPSSAVHPFIVMNFSGAAADVAGLAQAVGAGIARMLAFAACPLQPPQNLALSCRIAGVFGENIAMDRLARGETNPLARAAIETCRVQRAVAQVQGNAARFCFERVCHGERRKWAELSAEKISGLWLRVVQRYFGRAFDAAAAGMGRGWMAERGIFAAPFSSALRLYCSAAGLALFPMAGEAADKDAFARRLHGAFSAGHADARTILGAFGLAGGGKISEACLRAQGTIIRSWEKLAVAGDRPSSARGAERGPA